MATHRGRQGRCRVTTALAFVTGDVASAAKTLKNFAKDNDKLVVKAGVMEGSRLDADGVNSHLVDRFGEE